MSIGPSAHVSWKEVNCHNGVPYPEKWYYERLFPLLDIFESLRERWGAPIQILSCYRTPEYNASIGGARHSQHVEGRALDLTPADPFEAGHDVATFHRFIRDMLPSYSLVKGHGVYSWGDHIDIRPSSVLISW